MIFDDGGALLTNEPPLGCYGDSMANTCRYIVLIGMTDHPNWPEQNARIAQFRTSTGYLRHPKLAGIKDWDEEDTSGDQKFPFMMASRLCYYAMFEEAQKRCRTANTGCFAMSRGPHGDLFLLGLILIVQALLFKIPIRWSDDARDKKFVWVKDNDSADYLNYATALCYLYQHGYTWPIKVCGWITKPEQIFNKIAHYFYGDESGGTGSAWMVDLFSFSLARCFSGRKTDSPHVVI